MAEHWRGQHDLVYYLQTNWETVGPKLHVYIGAMDNFYLNNAVRELEAWMKTTEAPCYPGFFLYGEGHGHCWRGPASTAERLKDMAQYIQRNQPASTTTLWWEH